MAADIASLEGVWLHCRGGEVRIRRDGDDVVIDNPYAQQLRVPAATFFGDAGLRYFEHIGQVHGDRIEWSNSSWWARPGRSLLDEAGVANRRQSLRCHRRWHLRGSGARHWTAAPYGRWASLVAPSVYGACPRTLGVRLHAPACACAFPTPVAAEACRRLGQLDLHRAGARQLMRTDTAREDSAASVACRPHRSIPQSSL